MSAKPGHTPGDHHQLHEADQAHELVCRMSELSQEVMQLRNALLRNFAAGEIERFNFAATRLKQMDDRGSNALAYAIYNPNNFKVFVGLAGASADKDGLVIPKQKLVVAPLEVNGHIELGVSAEEVGEGGTILRVRFPTPQPFSVHALA